MGSLGSRVLRRRAGLPRGEAAAAGKGGKRKRSGAEGTGDSDSDGEAEREERLLHLRGRRSEGRPPALRGPGMLRKLQGLGGCRAGPGRSCEGIRGPREAAVQEGAGAGGERWRGEAALGAPRAGVRSRQQRRARRSGSGTGGHGRAGRDEPPEGLGPTVAAVMRTFQGVCLNFFVACFVFTRKKLKSTSKYIYQTLFLNGENSDIKICALGEEWNLHKIYLCQVSGSFLTPSKRMGILSKRMSENCEV